VRVRLRAVGGEDEKIRERTFGRERGRTRGLGKSLRGRCRCEKEEIGDLRREVMKDAVFRKDRGNWDGGVGI